MRGSWRECDEHMPTREAHVAVKGRHRHANMYTPSMCIGTRTCKHRSICGLCSHGLYSTVQSDGLGLFGPFGPFVRALPSVHVFQIALRIRTQVGYLAILPCTGTPSPDAVALVTIGTPRSNRSSNCSCNQ